MSYTLEKYNGYNRYHCPQCGKSKEFTRYINTETNEYISEVVGKCNKLDNCGYHYAPRQYFVENNIFTKPAKVKPVLKAIPAISKKTIEYLEIDLVEKSLNKNYINNFISFLRANFNEEDVTIAIRRYKIGTSKHYPGGTVFWQLDENNLCRYGKVFSYDMKTGKRDKTKTIKPVHTIREKYEFKPSQCLFGLHLVKDYCSKVVNVVESEKTAVIASIAFPDELWLATGGIDLLNLERIKPLKGRRIILHPDLGAFDKWKKKVIEFQKLGYNITISNFLEKIATEEQRKDSCDIADFILKEIQNQKEESEIGICSYESRLVNMITRNPAVQELIDKLELQLVD